MKYLFMLHDENCGFNCSHKICHRTGINAQIVHDRFNEIFDFTDEDLIILKLHNDTIYKYDYFYDEDDDEISGRFVKTDKDINRWPHHIEEISLGQLVQDLEYLFGTKLPSIDKLLNIVNGLMNFEMERFGMELLDDNFIMDYLEI